jgi:hypothetical protein
MQTSAQLANVIPVILSRARDAIEKPTIMSEFVQKVTLKDGDGTTYNWPKFATVLQAQSLTEGEPINNPQRLIPTPQQFTTSEVGVHMVLTDKAVRVTPEPMMARAGRFMGNAMKRRRETDMLGLFAGLSRDLGSAGSAWAPGWLSAAHVRLQAAAEANQVEPTPEGQRHIAVIHPFHYHDLLTSAATLGSNINDDGVGYFPIEGLTREIIQNYQIKQLYDVAIATSPLISIDGSDDAIGAIFCKDTFLLVETSVSMRMEKERDINLRGTAMVITSEYGTGELEDQFGFKMTADATAPAA